MNRTKSIQLAILRLALALWVVAAGVLTAGVLPAKAAINFHLESFSHEVTDAAGNPETQAGTHPFEVTTEAIFGTTTDSAGSPMPDGSMRNIEIELPPGFAGNPAGIPRCPAPDLIGEVTFSSGCKESAQIGVLTLHTTFGGPIPMPLYNMERPLKYPAQFAIAIPAYINAVVKPDGAIRVEASNISQGLTAYGVTVTLWGVPADPVHDGERGLLGLCYPFDGSGGGVPCPAGVPRTAFLTNPTSCLGEDQTVHMRANSWQDPETWISDEVELPPIEGCDKLEFDPAITVRPQQQMAAVPSAYEIELTVPQNEDPDGLVTPHLRDAEVTLPEGVAVNPAAASGLTGCSEAQIGLGSNEAARCPDSSKIGQVTLETPLLEELMTGSLFQAEQDENPFGSTLALYLEIEGSGVRQKLAGEVSPDPRTGRLTVTFRDNPQLPFSRLSIRLKGGPRAPLANPPTCGTKTTRATFIPWSAPDSGPTVEVTDSFEISSGPDGASCSATLQDRPFAPQMSSGVVNPVAGSQTPFVFRLTRQDGHQEILSTQVTPPEGLTAKLAGIPFCTDANAAAGSCGPESRVGTAITGAGAGSNPFYITNGEVFLAGPYEGAPLSLVIEVPAVAGPFDLGKVVVRAAVHVDPRTAQLTVVSDPIPQILEGIPLRVKDIRIVMDRPGFTIAPTSCEEMQVAATVQGSHGATAELQNRFQVGDCAALAFSPKLRFRAKEGRRATKRNFHPTLEATVSYPQSQYEGEGGVAQANIDRVAVTLPKGVFLDQDNLQTICTRAQFAEDNCPESTKVGDAEAHTPLLDEPLSGPVYLIASDNQLPDLVADLDGTIEIDLYGRIDQRKRRIRNTFEVVPDAPVSSFRLTIDGGRNEGLLVNSRNTCRRKALRRVNVRVFGQNGMTAHQRTQVKAPCKSKKRKLRRKARQLRRKAHRLDRRGDEAQAKKVMRRAHKVARRVKRS